MKSGKLPYLFLRAAFFILLLLCSVWAQAQAPEGIVRVKVKARHYLFLSDTLYYCDKTTMFSIPESMPYKIRKYPTPFLKRKYPAMVWSEIHREHPSNPETEDTLYNIKSESPYAPYAGRRIVGFVITRINAFGGSMHDTMYVKQTRLDRLADKIHISTHSWVIWNNLFVKRDTVVDPFRLADNERVLRSLYYMHDARIYVKEIPNSEYVYLEVITQDVWTIGLTAFLNSEEEVEARLYDRNFLGMGQSLMFKTRYNYTYHPETAVSFTYQKDNLMGTFLNPGFRISNMNDGVRQGGEYEGNIGVFVGRPLYTPVTRFTGNFDLSYNWSINKKEKSDSAFYEYRYNLFDVWAGYTFEQPFKKKKKWANTDRYRFMLSGRVILKNFTQEPIQDTSFTQFRYHDQQGYIGQVSLFHYNYYKTRYLLGFGRTEDVPYGYNLSFNIGMQKVLDKVRSYSGAQASYIFLRPKGHLWISSLYMSAFYHNGIEDGLVAINGSYYSSIHRISSWKFRQYIAAGYAVIYNNVYTNLLNINNTKGILGLSSDINGLQVGYARFTGTVYPTFKLVGFRFAFFATLSIAQITRGSDRFLLDNRLYTGLGLGFRTRNENLIFDEGEVTLNFFPVAPDDTPYFGVSITTNPKLVFDMGTVRAPSFVVY